MFNTILIGTVLVVIIIVTAYELSKPSTVTLFPYLDKCIGPTSKIAYDSRPQLAIFINGAAFEIPSNIGVQGTCLRPIHTLSNSGTIHILTDVNRTYTLGDFFNVWGNTFGPNFSTFRRDQIFGYKTDALHSLTLTVDNNGTTVLDNRFQDYPFPINANTTTSPVLIDIRYAANPA